MTEREKETAHAIIDMVEEAIRKAHPACDKIAKYTVIDGEKPNTLLYGEVYYDLENEILDVLTKYVCETIEKVLHRLEKLEKD